MLGCLKYCYAQESFSRCKNTKTTPKQLCILKSYALLAFGLLAEINKKGCKLYWWKKCTKKKQEPRIILMIMNNGCVRLKNFSYK